jgi:hypothetical protein
MQFADALYQLGVRDDTLTASEKESLDFEGFLALYDVVPPAQVKVMRSEMERLFELEQTGTAANPGDLAQLQNKSTAFDICVSHPRVLAAIWHVLREDFRSFGVHSRPNRPGKGHQGLHADWSGPPPKLGEYFHCNSIWPLADFTEINGATRVVPGSHRWEIDLRAEFPDPLARHPREKKLIAPAGAVVIFNSHVWHGATQNNSAQDRPNVTSFFGRRRYADGPGKPNFLSEEANARLDAAVRALFDGVEKMAGCART